MLYRKTAFNLQPTPHVGVTPSVPLWILQSTLKSCAGMWARTQWIEVTTALRSSLEGGDAGGGLTSFSVLEAVLNF